jgi:ABC-2 type transport system ATP-binding protein
MAKTQPVIRTSGLTKRYPNNITAVDHLDLEVEHGEVFGFLGLNGAGKTTTLRMLLGLIKPTSGSAIVAEHAPGDPVGLHHIGSMIEGPAFYPYLSARENLKVVADYGGVAFGRIDSALDQVGLLSRAHDPFAAYSMGMKQRLGVAAALMKDPELMILDEPTNGLDPEGVVEMRALIRRLGSGDRTVILSSHLLNEVEQTCDRVAIINHGKLVRQGTVHELRGEAALIVRATPSEGARRTLEGMLGSTAIAPVDGAFRVSVDPDRAADINAALVNAGMHVSELRPAERTLEEVFLTATKQERTAAKQERAAA